MTDIQSRKLNAAVAGQSVMDELLHIPIWNGQAAVVNKKTALDNCIIKIGKIEDKINDISGNSTTKSQAKETAAKTAWLAAKALTAFAEDTNDDVLHNEIDFEFTDLRFVSDNEAVDNWQLVHDRANTHVVALAAGGYGVDAAMVLQLQGEIDTFKNWKGKPKAAKADKKAQIKLLKEEFVTLDTIIESLKERIVQFALSHPDFYNAVLDAFEVDDIGIRHNAIRFIFIDSATGIRLPKVKTVLVEKQLEKKSSKVGVSTYSQQEAPQGNYSSVSSLPGYVNVPTNNIGVQSGKMTRVVVTMVKN